MRTLKAACGIAVAQFSYEPTALPALPWIGARRQALVAIRVEAHVGARAGDAAHEGTAQVGHREARCLVLRRVLAAVGLADGLEQRVKAAAFGADEVLPVAVTPVIVDRAVGNRVGIEGQGHAAAHRHLAKSRVGRVVWSRLDQPVGGDVDRPRLGVAACGRQILVAVAELDAVAVAAAVVGAVAAEGEIAGDREGAAGVGLRGGVLLQAADGIAGLSATVRPGAAARLRPAIKASAAIDRAQEGAAQVGQAEVDVRGGAECATDCRE
jgi:hypothetical protein